MSEKRSEKQHRQKVSKSVVCNAEDQLFRRLMERLKEKGYGTWTSRHEILGMIEEEKYELTKAVHEEGFDGIKRELLDIAVGCVFAIACIDEDTLDW